MKGGLLEVLLNVIQKEASVKNEKNIPNFGKKVKLGDGSIGTVVNYKPRNFKYPYIVEARGKRYKVGRLNLV